MSVGVIIVAAGSSQRMLDKNLVPLDKIFAELGGKPIISYSLDVFNECSFIDEIVLVVGKNNLEQGCRLIAGGSWSKVSNICVGGATRTDSVISGIKKLGECDIVMIHDGARPFITQDIIENGLTAVKITGSAIPVILIKDTVKQVEQTVVQHTIPKDSLVLAQTPQIFRLDIIREAIHLVSNAVTDDSALVESIGRDVVSFLGDENNIKITTPFDMKLAELILRHKSGI